MSLQQDLAQWDGKSAVAITAVYTTHHQTDNFIPVLIASLADPVAQKGGSWCLKKHLETAGTLTPAQIDQIYGSLPQLDNWETKLHLLQSVPYLPISPKQEKVVESFIRQNIISDKKFVRAWAYYGLYELAVQYPNYQQETEQVLTDAMQTESGSVQARIRQALKKGFTRTPK